MAPTSFYTYPLQKVYPLLGDVKRLLTLFCDYCSPFAWLLGRCMSLQVVLSDVHFCGAASLFVRTACLFHIELWSSTV